MSPIEGPEAGHTELYWAAHRGDRSRVRALLAAGAPLDAEMEDDGETVLHAAARRGDADLVEDLLVAGAGVLLERFNQLNWSPLITAVEAGSLQVVEVLLAAGARVNARLEDRIGETALHHAVRAGKIEVVEQLLRAGADPRLEGWMRLRPLDLVQDPKLHGHRQMRVLMERALRES